MNYTIRNLGVGAAIGYGASIAMDRASGWYLAHHSKKPRQREEEVTPGTRQSWQAGRLPAWSAATSQTNRRRRSAPSSTGRWE
jgi:hypothetical protein